jgi:hypothetical protein
MVFKVKSYKVAFDDGQHNDPSLETVCPVIVDALVRTQADADAMLSQLRLLCRHRPLIIAAFLPEKTLRRHGTLIISSAEEVENDA